jgi:outer membrane protein
MFTFFKTELAANIIKGLLVAAVLYAATLATILYTKSTKIGYIESSVLLQKYPAAVKARQEFDQKTEEWKKNIQTLETELNQLNQEMVTNASKWSHAQLAQKEEVMKKKQSEYGRYRNAINEKAQQTENEIFQPVYADINAKIADFSKAKGYDLVFGTVSGGNILYGDKAVDLTDKFLEFTQVPQKK